MRTSLCWTSRKNLADCFRAMSWQLRLVEVGSQSRTTDAREMQRAVTRAHGFMQFLNDAITTNPAEQVRMQLLDEFRMRTLMPGEFACQEVGDILLRFFCRLISADYYDNLRSSVEQSCDSWPGFRAKPKTEDLRFLVFSTSMAAAVSTFHDMNETARCKKWADRVSKLLDNGYNASSWAVVNNGHYIAVILHRDDSAGLMHCTQADSSSGIRREPKLHPGLLRGFEAVCANFTAERPIALSLEPSSLGPKQQDPDCLLSSLVGQYITLGPQKTLSHHTSASCPLRKPA